MYGSMYQCRAALQREEDLLLCLLQEQPNPKSQVVMMSITQHFLDASAKKSGCALTQHPGLRICAHLSRDKTASPDCACVSARWGCARTAGTPQVMNKSNNVHVSRFHNRILFLVVVHDRAVLPYHIILEVWAPLLRLLAPVTRPTEAGQRVSNR